MSNENQSDGQIQLGGSRYLSYIHASLADASRLTPNRKNDHVELSPDELARGQLDRHATRKLMLLAQASQKKPGGKVVDEDRLWPISVLVCPRVYGLMPEHGVASWTLPARITPLVLSAKLGKDGQLFDDESAKFPAIVPRELLEPCFSEVTIGTIDAADEAYATLNNKRGTWINLMNLGEELVRKVTGVGLMELAIDRYRPVDNEPCVFLYEGGSYSIHVQRLVDLLREPDAPAVPLFDALMTQASDRPLIGVEEQLALSAHHVGQMESRYGLSPSQRESLMHHLDARPNVADILAVDGPPGTGKTTLLLSAIANLWVQRALQEGEPPIIAAVSTNRNAVVNILRAFSEVKEPDGPLAGRWLAAAQSYGLFFPSRSKTELGAKDFLIQQLIGAGGQAVYDARKYETVEGLEEGGSAFLAKYKEAFKAPATVNLADAAQALLTHLREESEAVRRTVATLKALGGMLNAEPISSVGVAARLEARQKECAQCIADMDAGTKIAAEAKKLRLQWARHVEAEPWGVSLLAAFHLRAKRRRRDRVFCAEAEVTYGAAIAGSLCGATEQSDIDEIIRRQFRTAMHTELQARHQVTIAKAEFDQLLQAVQSLRHLVPEPGELTVDAVQIVLDKGHRFTAFKLATHYWEARYLLEVQEHLDRYPSLDDSKAPAKLQRQYQRLAKLHPCFVTTLQTLPDRFIGFKTVPQPLCNFIDLLIVDEAGQISPEIGAAAFALAKRALVVGDVDQIEPIWSIPAIVDDANIQRFNIVSSKPGLEAFHEASLSASSGNLMRLAQRATPYAKHPARGRGMFLSEHRRCWPEIIRMCNVLVYQGLLQPCREEGPRRILPSVGYAHIPGTDCMRGHSRENVTEAAAIAQWLKLRRNEIETAFQDDKKDFGQLVSVITPFSAQSWAIQKAMSREFGSAHGVTIGTLHAMQGAERRVVIFSPTYGLNTPPGSTFFDRGRSMLNVAISRAQDAFLVVGNMHLFNPSGGHPSAVIGRMLFGDGSNEIPDVPVNLLLPGHDMASGTLIANLESHRAALREALETARNYVVIVSPFLAGAAIEADGIAGQIERAVARGVFVRVVSDLGLNRSKQGEYQQCVKTLEAAGARVSNVQSQGVHSKMILVDRSWLVVGSFNWLSAVRDRTSIWARYESSIRYDGSEAFQMISKSLSDLKEIIQPQ